jgi:hypothetical protein
MESTEYPIQTDDLSKGSVITADELERATGVRRDSDRYRLGLLKVRDYITERFRDRGEIITVKQEGDTLRILTDAEATEYNERSAEQGLAKMGRALVRQVGVDVRNLTDAQRRDHERRLLIQSKTLQAARAGRRAALQPGRHERTTPQLNGPEDDAEGA